MDLPGLENVGKIKANPSDLSNCFTYGYTDITKPTIGVTAIDLNAITPLKGEYTRHHDRLHGVNHIIVFLHVHIF